MYGVLTGRIVKIYITNYDLGKYFSIFTVGVNGSLKEKQTVSSLRYSN